MEKRIKSYCEVVKHLEESNVDCIYHDTEYGFPVTSDSELFERLVLEINQAGLNWRTILNKRNNFKKAFHYYDIEKIASYTNKDRDRLLNNVGIIRNHLKIDAVIYNANVVLKLQKEFGSFKNWLDTHHPLTNQEWVKLFKKTFKFTGKEIVNEFLLSTGYLKGSHIESCPIYEVVLKSNPAWLISNRQFPNS